jgi:hypothetical protein
MIISQSRPNQIKTFLKDIKRIIIISSSLLGFVWPWEMTPLERPWAKGLAALVSSFWAQLNSN